MMNGPQRGRRSQHGAKSAANRASSGSRRNGNMETELGSEYPPSSPASPAPAKAAGGSGPAAANNDPSAMESGFFNKYASMSDDKTDPGGDQAKPVTALERNSG